MGKVFNLIVQGLLLPGLWDTQCGFKLFRGPVARELFGQVRTAGFAYDVEVLYVARRSGYEVSEVPVRWMNSATTRVDAFRHSGQMLRDILRIRFAK
jgi:dolichyl-phosphate beta-glucosyltransferase